MSTVGAFFSSLTLAVGFHEFVQFVRNFYNLILDSNQPDSMHLFPLWKGTYSRHSRSCERSRIRP